MLEKVAEIIRKYKDIPENQIHLESYLYNDLSLNSFELVEMLCELEENVGIEIEDDVLVTFRTVGDIVNYLENGVRQ